MRATNWALIGLFIGVATTSHAETYSEVEPNNSYPPSFLPNNPIFKSGDRIFGQLNPAGDQDYFYIRTNIPSEPGIYRYRFEMTTGNADTQLDLFDTLSDTHTLSANDDYLSRGFEPVCIFEHLETEPQMREWGLFARHFNNLSVLNYNITVLREQVTPLNFGVVPPGNYSQFCTNPAGGLATWLKFTLPQESDVVLDTIGALSGADTELALFNGLGQTIAANDDIDRDLGTYTSRISKHLQAGVYYVATARYNMSANWNELTGTTLGWNLEGVGFLGDVQPQAGFWPVRLTVTSTEILPQSFTVLKGEQFIGSLSSLFISDDERIVVYPDSTDSICRIECFADGPFSAVSELRLLVEASAGRPGLTQSIQMFNFGTNQYDEVDGRIAPADDLLVEVTLSSTANAHLGNSGEVFARVNWEPVNDEDPAQDGWEHRLDLLKWIAVP